VNQKSFRGASTPIGAVIQVLRWMITAKVARSQIPLFPEAVIWNWSRKSQISIAYNLDHPSGTMHGVWCLETNTTSLLTCLYRRTSRLVDAPLVTLNSASTDSSAVYEGNMPGRANLFQVSALQSCKHQKCHLRCM